MKFVAWIALICAVATPGLGQRVRNPNFRDGAVIGAFQRRSPAIVHFTTLYRRPLDASFDLLLVRGGAPGDGWSRRGDIPWLREGDLLGLFLISRVDASEAYEIAVDSEAGSPESRVEVVRADDSSIVVTRTGDYGIEAPRIKYFFDVRSKSLRARREFARGGVEIAGPPWRLQPVEEGIRVMPQGRSACASVPAFGGGYELKSFGADATYLPGCEIRRQEAGGERRFIVPISTRDELVQARPETARQFRKGDYIGFNETIGPALLHEGMLWFGISFYDGEGSTGIGGFGWFDPAAERFELIRPPEMADWSASAILVEEDAVWLGLVSRPEGAERSGGLLRWDRRSGRAQRWAEVPFPYEIRRDRSRLLLAGGGGGAIVEGGRVRLLLMDVDIQGRRRLIDGPAYELGEPERGDGR